MNPQEFWDWFADHVEEIEAGVQSAGSGIDPQLAELDRRVKTLDPKVGWEIGPDEVGWFFALSPKGSPETLERTVEMVRNAPADIAGWKFLPAKPPKMWERQVQFGAHEVDARQWRYQLRQWEDGGLGIVWGVAEGLNIDAEVLVGLGWFVLESELGEETTIRAFVDVEMTRLSEWPEPTAGGPIDLLQEHVVNLVDDA